MAGLVEQSPIQRINNANWVNYVIIPKLHKKQFPLPKALQVLYRANTTGIKDEDFKKKHEQLIMEKRRKKAQAEKLIMTSPVRGDISRTIKIIENEYSQSLSIHELRDLKAIKMFFTHHIEDGKKWIYVPPAQRVDELASILVHSTDELLQRADNFQQALPVIADFVLLFDALHPHLDGNGRSFRAASNYMAYSFGYRFNYPLSEGHLDVKSKKFLEIMMSFEYNIQNEAGYTPIILPEEYPSDEYKKQINLTINYEKLSDSFEKIILQRRENKKLLPFYQQMDVALGKIAIPRIK